MNNQTLLFDPIKRDKIPMSMWCQDDQPVYKLVMKGKYALSDAELLCLIIGTGNCNDNALELAKMILTKANGNLTEVARMSIKDLENIKGIGKAKATAIMAAFELSKRKDLEAVLFKEKISCSRDAFDIFKSVIGDIPYEEFWIILLNRNNRINKKERISEGGMSGTVVDPKKIFKIALDHHASSLVLGHNHPSGNPEPSETDKMITTKLKQAGQLLDIAVLDHIIVAGDKFYSFADEGIL